MSEKYRPEFWLLSCLLCLQCFAQKQSISYQIGAGFIHGETIGEGLLSDDIGLKTAWQYSHNLWQELSYFDAKIGYFQGQLDRSDIRDSSFSYFSGTCAITSFGLGIRSYTKSNRSSPIFNPFFGINAGIDLLSTKANLMLNLPPHLRYKSKTHFLAYFEWQAGVAFHNHLKWSLELFVTVHTNFNDELDGLVAQSNGQVDLIASMGIGIKRNFR